MRDRQTAGFLRIVEEIPLCILIGIIADDFNGLFVSTDRTVGAEAPEFAARGALFANA